MKRIIALAGMPGSGKSTAGEFLKQDGLKLIRMSDPVKREMQKEGLEINNVSLREFVLNARQKFGNNYVLNLLKKDIVEALKTNETIILDGSRNISEINELRKEKYNTIVVAIVADKMTRYERIVERNSATDLKTMKEFEWREEQELKFGQAEIIATADYYLVNNLGLDELKANLKSVFDKILAK